MAHPPPPASHLRRLSAGPHPTARRGASIIASHRCSLADFPFDECVSENESTWDVYRRTAQPLVAFIFEGGIATCFAYGQTGSGKTFTMAGQGEHTGVYGFTAREIFEVREAMHGEVDVAVFVSYFEIYGGKVFDLLQGRNQLRVLEDGDNAIQIHGLNELGCEDADEVLAAIDAGNGLRASGVTSANEQSSRSHAVFQILLREVDEYDPTGQDGDMHGKLLLIDLAGSERGADTAHADRKTRIEGSEINKSLLALKECIRALGSSSSHTPFRASKVRNRIGGLRDTRRRASLKCTCIPLPFCALLIFPSPAFLRALANVISAAHSSSEGRVCGAQHTHSDVCNGVAVCIVG